MSFLPELHVHKVTMHANGRWALFGKYTAIACDKFKQVVLDITDEWPVRYRILMLTESGLQFCGYYHRKLHKAQAELAMLRTAEMPDPSLPLFGNVRKHLRGTPMTILHYEFPDYEPTLNNNTKSIMFGPDHSFAIDQIEMISLINAPYSPTNRVDYQFRILLITTERQLIAGKQASLAEVDRQIKMIQRWSPDAPPAVTSPPVSRI